MSKPTQAEAVQIFIRRSVPNDHECLFTAIGYLAEGSRLNNCAVRLREVCAQGVMTDTDRFSEVMLGMPSVQYADVSVALAIFFSFECFFFFYFVFLVLAESEKSLTHYFPPYPIPARILCFCSLCVRVSVDSKSLQLGRRK
jgi:hypothetical protein